MSKKRAYRGEEDTGERKRLRGRVSRDTERDRRLEILRPRPGRLVPRIDACQEAHARLRVTGWVRNRADGNVEVRWSREARKRSDAITAWARRGLGASAPPRPLEALPAEGDFLSFEKRATA